LCLLSIVLNFNHVFCVILIVIIIYLNLNIYIIYIILKAIPFFALGNIDTSTPKRPLPKIGINNNFKLLAEK